MTTEESKAAEVLIPTPPAAPKTFTEEALRQEVSRATSKFQRETANANKQAKTLQTEMDDLRQKLAAAEEDAKVARLAGDDEEEGTRVRERLRLERELTQRERRVGVLERQQTMRLLSQTFGIPEEDLDGHETAADMEMAARDFRLKALEAENQQLKGAKAPDEPVGPKKPGFDTAGGKLSPSNVDWMKKALSKDPKDTADFEARVQEALRRR